MLHKPFWSAKDCEPWYWDTGAIGRVTTPSPAVHGFIASSSSTSPTHQPHPIPHHQKVELHLPHDGDVLSSYEELQCKYMWIFGRKIVDFLKSSTIQDAVTALNSLQTNFSVLEAIRKSGKKMNHQAIPEMIEWVRRIGYKVLLHPHPFLLHQTDDICDPHPSSRPTSTNST